MIILQKKERGGGVMVVVDGMTRRVHAVEDESNALTCKTSFMINCDTLPL